MSDEKALPINPYLADIIQIMKANESEGKLREEYERACREADGKGRALPWLEFLGERALRDAIRENPILKMRRSKMPLPMECLEGLYWLRVDVVADLLQISEEELRRFEKQERLDVSLIEQFLLGLGLKLYQGTEDSWKIPSLRIVAPANARQWQTWDFASLEGHKTHLSRPTTIPEWFDEYYQRFEQYPNEEKLGTEWLKIRPESNGDEMPFVLEEFFRDTRCFFDEYRIVCEKHGIPIQVDTPGIPDSADELKYFTNDRYVAIKKEVVRAVLSVFENSDALGMPIFSFLLADDERKLSITEEIKEDDALQLMLIEYVGFRVDMVNVIDYFQDLSNADGTPQMTALPERPDPINPWLAELILKDRKSYSDDTIRAAYKTLCEIVPDKSWEDFLAERAMLHESRRNPFIMTDLQDCDLPEETKGFLSSRCSVENVADLLQITVEEYKELFEGKLDEVTKVEEYLQSYGLHLYHSDRRTYKLSFLKK